MIIEQWIKSTIKWWKKSPSDWTSQCQRQMNLLQDKTGKTGNLRVISRLFIHIIFHKSNLFFQADSLSSSDSIFFFEDSSWIFHFQISQIFQHFYWKIEKLTNKLLFYALFKCCYFLLMFCTQFLMFSPQILSILLENCQ